VTTNPTHIAATGRGFDEVLDEIFKIVDGPISVETVSLQSSAIVEEGRAIHALHKNAIVKVPVMVEGLKAVKQLTSEDRFAQFTTGTVIRPKYWRRVSGPPRKCWIACWLARMWRLCLLTCWSRSTNI
jgi:Transaldolase/Fructose-6-phosphate aldolase